MRREISESSLISKLNEEYHNAEFGSNELVQNRNLAYQYFRKVRPNAPGDITKSGAISADVQNGVLSTLAEVKQAFNKSDLVKIVPDNFRNVEEAQKESEVLNSLFFDRNEGEVIINDIIFDSLMQRNSILKVYIEDRVLVMNEVVEGVTEESIDEVIGPRVEGEDVEIVGQEQIDEGEELIDLESGAIKLEEIYSIEIKRSTPQQRLRIEVIPLEEMRVNSDLSSIDMQEARFVCHTSPISVSELIERGYDEEEVKKLPEYSQTFNTVRGINTKGTNYNTSDESTEIKEIHEAYYNIDYDMDNIAERRRIIWGGNYIFENETTDYVPFASGASILQSHQFPGVSLFDRLKGIQDQKTLFLRQLIDNAVRANRERVGALKGQVDMARLLDNSNVVPMTTPNAVFPFPHEKILQEGVGILKYLDEVRSESGGNAIDLTSENMMVNDQSAHATERLTSKLEVNAETIAHNLTISIFRSMFLLMHKVMRTQWVGEVMTFNRDIPEYTNPMMWNDLTCIKLKTNMSTGQKNARLGAYGALSMQIEKLAASGKAGILFNDTSIYNLIRDMAQTSGITNTEDYLINPSSPEGQQANQQQEMKRQEAEERGKQLEEMQIQMPLTVQKTRSQADVESSRITSQNEIREEEVRAMSNLQQQMLELEYKYDQLRFDVMKETDDIVDSKEEREMKDQIERSKMRNAMQTQIGKVQVSNVGGNQ